MKTLTRFSWFSLGFALTFAVVLEAYGEAYRCPGNRYTDTPAPGCKPVAERISIVSSPHAQHVANRERIAEDNARKPVEPPPAPPLARPLDDSSE